MEGDINLHSIKSQWVYYDQLVSLSANDYQMDEWNKKLCIMIFEGLTGHYVPQRSYRQF